MCAALPYNQPLDFRPAYGTGLIFPIIHPKIILEFAAAIDPINGRAVAADAFGQHRADRIMQTGGLLPSDGIGGGLRMELDRKSVV